MLKIKNLNLKIEEKEIIKNLNIEFKKGKIYCLLWKNWSGKSSLSQAIAWNPKYSDYTWEISLDSEIINELLPNERSHRWIFLAFQNIPEIKWIKLSEFLRTIYNDHQKKKNESFNGLSPFMFKRFLKNFIEEVWISEDFLDRDLNVWFSGWEKRKVEILQMKLLNPKYIILDEIDSWLDLNSVKNVSLMLKELSSENNTFIIITHNFWIIEQLKIDEVIIMSSWEISEKWDSKLIDKIRKDGF